MYDREKLGKIFSDIRRYFTDLGLMNIKDAGDLEDKKTFYAVSMLLLSIINRAIDLAFSRVPAVLDFADKMKSKIK